MAGQNRSKVDDGVEGLKQTFAIVAVGLPTTAKIARVDQVLPFPESVSFNGRSRNLALGEDASDDQEALLVKSLALGRGEYRREGRRDRRHEHGTPRCYFPSRALTL